jgi:transcription-repair coupling factor (superfamily II helicase)
MIIDPLHPLLPNTVNPTVDWGDLTGQAALALANAALQADFPLAVMTPDLNTAHRLYEELTFFAPDLPLFLFPNWETLPYDHFSPHQDIISDRLQTLYQLSELGKGIVLVDMHTVLQKLPPRSFICSNRFVFQQGEKLDREVLRTRLQAQGYHAVEQVIEHGEYAVRGSLFDLYPMGSELPYRLDLLDNEIDSIRTFDPETQRTIEKVNEVCLLPAHEFPLDEAGIRFFREKWRDTFPGNPANCTLYNNISQGFSSPGIEYYLPLFFSEMNTFFDYLPSQTCLVQFGHIDAAATQYHEEVAERYEQYRYDIQKPLLAPAMWLLSGAELNEQIAIFSQIQIRSNQSSLAFLNVDNTNPLEKLIAFQKREGQPVLICADSKGRAEVLVEKLQALQVFPKQYDYWQAFLNNADSEISVAVAELSHSFQVNRRRCEGACDRSNPEIFSGSHSLDCFASLATTEDESVRCITVISESELYGQKVLQKERRRSSTQVETGSLIRQLSELTVGSAVVHLNHGVGLYQGLEMITVDGVESEYLTLEYANKNKLYVPVAHLHLITRYGGIDPDRVSLHSLGSHQWEKHREKAVERAYDVAAELLALNATRQARQGFAFAKPDQAYQQFADNFLFEETPDQEIVIQQVINDMTSPQPMDRLVCGDVGFGKTEIAMRAAFLAVQSHKQVGILVPTTLLAQQHYESFQDRFANTGVNIDLLSRFRSTEEQKEALSKLASGKLDILIGTHKLLQPSIVFKDLGLIIIDEEHRFGVQQKEKMKALRAEVDILTLTATPIPRTLNMALSDVRDLSIIQTPPARRLAIKTFLYEYEKNIIREAILREITRGGQVYFLHNNVTTIVQRGRELAEWLPEAKIQIAHGQLRKHELEKIMADFYHQNFNVLLCTTIIETGIDVPSANTIIMERADKFGLAQLHQLRGRVGRSHHQAYAYLLIPARESLTPDAEKRLKAITDIEDLGAGFMLASHDLEIRGAGEFLGEEQTGHIQTVGLSLYMEFLDRAVKSLKAGKKLDLSQPLLQRSEVDLGLTAIIPEDYIHDVHTRLVLYKRIANADNKDALWELQVEMIDRFGLMPAPLKILFTVTELKLKCQQLGIQKITVNAQFGRIEFEKEPQIDVNKLIKLIQLHPAIYKLESNQRIRAQMNTIKPEQRAEFIFALLEKLI